MACGLLAGVAMRGYTFWSSVGCYLLVACGGVTTDRGRSQGVSGDGSGGGKTRVVSDYDASFEPAHPGSGGAGGVPVSGKGGSPGAPVATARGGTGDGGAPPSHTGGAPPSFASGGATGGSGG